MPVPPLPPGPPRRFCRACGWPVQEGLAACAYCNAVTTPTASWVTPSRQPDIKYPVLPFPWGQLRWPAGSAVSLTARYGIGKSTIAARLHSGAADVRIGAWITPEQIPGPVNQLFIRQGLVAPPIYAVDPADPLPSGRRAIETLTSPPGSITVVDSLTPFGMDESVWLMNLVIRDCQATGRRGLFINQTNKADDIAGRASLQFTPDFELLLDVDFWGQRRLVARKSRWGATFVQYWRFTRDGAVVAPDFLTMPHSVEGAFPDFELVPYGFATGSIPGLPGRARGRTHQLAGLLDALALEGVLPEFAGRASAAAASPATACGFVAPADEDHRQALAEAHGLRWLPVTEGVAALERARREKAERAAADGADIMQGLFRSDDAAASPDEDGE